MKSERVYPYQLESGDLVVVRPKGSKPYARQIENFKRTPNAVSYYLGDQHYHFSTVGRAREGKVLIERVVRDHAARPWPFMRKDGRIVEDQLCACGRLQPEHGPGYAGTFGHGSLEESGCSKFTWTEFVEREA